MYMDELMDFVSSLMKVMSRLDYPIPTSHPCILISPCVQIIPQIFLNVLCDNGYRIHGYIDRIFFVTLGCLYGPYLLVS